MNDKCECNSACNKKDERQWEKPLLVCIHSLIIYLSVPCMQMSKMSIFTHYSNAQFFTYIIKLRRIEVEWYYIKHFYCIRWYLLKIMSFSECRYNLLQLSDFIDSWHRVTHFECLRRYRYFLRWGRKKNVKSEKQEKSSLLVHKSRNTFQCEKNFHTQTHMKPRNMQIFRRKHTLKPGYIDTPIITTFLVQTV